MSGNKDHEPRPRWLNPSDAKNQPSPSWWERTKAKIKSPQFEDSLWDGLDHAVRAGCLSRGCFSLLLLPFLLVLALPLTRCALSLLH